MGRIAFLLALVAMPHSAIAGIVKCTDADGNVTYQQTDCPEQESQEKKVVRNTDPATLTEQEKFNAEAYKRGMTPDELRSALEVQRQQRLGIQPARQAPVISVPQPTQRRSGGGRGFRGTGGQQTASGNDSCPPGQVPIGGSSYGSGTGFSSSSGYTKVKCVAPSQRDGSRVTQVPPNTVPQDQTLRDQNGNEYYQPAGSSFVRDKKTGKQCFKYGNFVKCD